LKEENGDSFGLCDDSESRVYGDSGLGCGVMANCERRAVGEMDMEDGRLRVGMVSWGEAAAVVLSVGRLGGGWGEV